mgnify:FL=1|tara:strand:+ start:482 stop:760 length:279 start_codon:yes stop_codon:yes gene_type:complete
MSTVNDGPPDYDEEEAGVIEIPYQSLSADALSGIVQEFASRDGTDYGEFEFSLADKVSQVEAQLKSGHLSLLFDPISQSCQIVNSREWKSNL